MPRKSHIQSLPKRRGITLIIVLMLISITLALSYTMVRSQISAIRIQGNSTRRDLAYEAALTGISTAIRTMNNNAWAGVGVPISGALSSYESYQVTFTTGDPALTAAGANNSDYPYRVTLLSTGSSVDPAHGTTTTRRIQAVVRLIVAQLGAESSDWAAMQQFTVYQTNVKPFTLNSPCRIEGPVRVQGAVTICPDYSWSTATRSRYMSDLTAMSAAGSGSYQPLTGPVTLPTPNTSNQTRSLMTNELALTLYATVATQKAAHSYPTQFTSYRIYPGGKLYQVPQLSASLQSTTLAPDPVSNPLGIYFAPNNITLGGNVTITGTLVTGGDVHVSGTAHLLPFNLPALKGSTLPVRLPVVVAQDNFVLDSTGSGDATGMILAQNEFLLDTGPTSAAFAVLGRVVSDQFVIRGRTQWDNVNTNIWSMYWNLFNAQLSWSSTQRISFFPLWLSMVGLSPTPQLTIKPDPTPLAFHWQDPTQPFYVASPAATGLQWDLVSWTDNP